MNYLQLASIQTLKRASCKTIGVFIKILLHEQNTFTFADLQRWCPNVGKNALHDALKDLKTLKLITCRSSRKGQKFTYFIMLPDNREVSIHTNNTNSPSEKENVKQTAFRFTETDKDALANIGTRYALTIETLSSLIQQRFQYFHSIHEAIERLSQHCEYASRMDNVKSFPAYVSACFLRDSTLEGQPKSFNDQCFKFRSVTMEFEYEGNRPTQKSEEPPEIQGDDVEGLWTKVLHTLKQHIDRPAFNTWLQPTTLQSIDTKQAVIAVPGEVFDYWLTEYYANKILLALKKILGVAPKELKFVIVEQESEEKTKDLKTSCGGEGPDKGMSRCCV